jgi:hypothetical protein
MAVRFLETYLQLNNNRQVHYLLLALDSLNMRIPYVNIPCLLNETCFHGQCIRINDILIGWYEFCHCDQNYHGIECNEQAKFTRIDWFIILIVFAFCVSLGLCLASIPFLYRCLQEDFYPQIIECTRSTPYVEVHSWLHCLDETNIRLYRIPSEYLSTKRTILDGLIPLHTIASLANPTHIISSTSSPLLNTYQE